VAEVNGNGNGKWAQIVASVVLAFLSLAQVGVLWILSSMKSDISFHINDIKTDVRGNKQEFYAKLDRVVLFYQDGQKTTMDAIKAVCDNQTVLFKTLEKHETLLHFDHPRRKEFFKEHKP